MHIFLEILKTICAVWHVVAFAFGGVYVVHSYRAILGLIKPAKFWKRMIRGADTHLWLSGFAVIAVGASVVGVSEYFANPKLWAKILVVTVWFISTQYMRRYAMFRFIRGFKTPMLAASSVNVSCWVYGAFLGCAKGLANGVMPFYAFVIGFIFILLVCSLTTYVVHARRQKVSG